jgi:serine protease Do
MAYIKKLYHASYLLMMMLCSTTALCAEATASPIPTLAPVLKQVVPAIVNVAVQGTVPEDLPLPPAGPDAQNKPNPNQGLPEEQTRKFQSIGSGVIIDPEHGIILTNDHVIRHASLVTITLNDGRRLKAHIIGSDSATDVAVLKIDAKNLKSLPIGDSDATEVGDFVMAIGNPFGLNSFGNSQSATFGIVSAKHRSDLNIEGIENFIQTDAAINPGSSGGALVNTKGELIGINTAIISLHGGNVGIGFAIPINMAKDVAQQIIQYGTIQRGLMGVFVQPLTPELAQAMGYSDNLQGALIAQINAGSPAEKAGLKPGDIITKINTTEITQASQVKTTVSLLRAGSNAKMFIKRKGQDMNITATITDIKAQEQSMQTANPFLYGLSFHDFEQDTPMHGHIIGVQIVGASENSAGWRAGLRPGDVIISANHEPTKEGRILQTIANQQKKQLLVQVLRGMGALYILII